MFLLNIFMKLHTGNSLLGIIYSPSSLMLYYVKEYEINEAGNDWLAVLNDFISENEEGWG